MQILTHVNYVFVDWPDKARKWIVGGNELDILIYVCRTLGNWDSGKHHIGKFHDKSCYVPKGGKEHKVKSYEVLVKRY